MCALALSYESHSRASKEGMHLEGAQCANPGRFVARLKDPSAFRLGLTTLGSIVRSNYEVMDYDEWVEMVLDPVVGIHPDGVSFEAFSQDVSALGWVHFSNAVFDEPTVREAGCTNIDYTDSLDNFLRSLTAISKVEISIGTSSGLELKTPEKGHHEKKIPLPDNWKLAFGELHAGLLQAKATLELSKTDLLNLIRWVKKKAKMVEKGRAVRLHLAPGEKAHAIVEPWNQTVRFSKVPEGIDEPVEWRLYGRRRLEALEPLIPYIQSARVYLLGDSRPHYWELTCRNMRFIFALSSWSARKFSSSFVESLRGSSVPVEEEKLIAAAKFASDCEMVSFDELAAEIDCTPEQAKSAGLALCRAGLCCAEPGEAGLRWRPVHSDSFEDVLAGVGSSREKNAESLIDSGKLTELKVVRREGLTVASAKIEGNAGIYDSEATIEPDGSFAKGACTCKWMTRQGNSMKGGPCKHLLALRAAALRQIKDASVG